MLHTGQLVHDSSCCSGSCQSFRKYLGGAAETLDGLSIKLTLSLRGLVSPLPPLGQGAADAAAIAGAYAVRDTRAMGARDMTAGCDAARAVASRVAARLTQCRPHFDGSVTVVVSIDTALSTITRSARAGRLTTR